MATYTKDVPMLEGWYFARRLRLHHGRPVRVFDESGTLFVSDEGVIERLEEYTTDMEWSPEPLVEPDGPVDEQFGFRDADHP